MDGVEGSGVWSDTLDGTLEGMENQQQVDGRVVRRRHQTRQALAQLADVDMRYLSVSGVFAVQFHHANQQKERRESITSDGRFQPTAL